MKPAIVTSADEAWEQIADIVAHMQGDDDDAPVLCEALAKIRDLADQGIAAEAETENAP